MIQIRVINSTGSKLPFVSRELTVRCVYVCHTGKRGSQGGQKTLEQLLLSLLKHAVQIYYFWVFHGLDY